MRRRLIIANLIVVSAVLILLEIPLALIYSRHEHDALDAGLQRDAAALAVLAGEVIEHPAEHDVVSLAARFSGEPAELATIVDGAGNDLANQTVLSRDPGFRSALAAARAGSAQSGEVDGIVFVALPVTTDSAPTGAVLVARPDESIDHRVHQFWLVLIGLGAGVLAISLVVSSRVSRWVVDPLNRLDEQAAALGRGDLSVRADANEGPPEVVTLAATFNEMAVRLDELVSSQRRFVADASHQLRSPLTALRLRLEGLDPHDPAATAAGREAALAEAARLTRLVDGLLSLARAEGRRPERQHLSIAAVIEERAEAWMPLASEQHVDLDVALDRADPMTALLVPGSLEQILDNLVDNALDASPPHSAVLLSAARVGQTIEIHVIDQGAGMTDTEQRNAFEPFWRGTNGPSAVGTGLGLAIAQQLARASQGSISLERADSGGVDAIVRFAPEGVLVGT